MEKTTKELIREEFIGTNYPGEKFSFSVAKNRKEDKAGVEIGDIKQSIESLLKEEEILQTRLTELKKENFSLQTSISAWQVTLKNKLEEFNEADLKLNEIYKEIWSERENFCSETDKFNNEYGILSEWWQRQMKFVSDLENLEKETLEKQKCLREINKLEKQVVELKREIEAEVEMHSTQDGDCCRKKQAETEVIPGEPDMQKFLQTDDQIEIGATEANTVQNELFSIVDLEKVRMANRRKHRRCKSHFFARVKKLGLLTNVRTSATKN